jgi:hypothetical protein
VNKSSETSKYIRYLAQMNTIKRDTQMTYRVGLFSKRISGVSSAAHLLLPSLLVLPVEAVVKPSLVREALARKPKELRLPWRLPPCELSLPLLLEATDA